MGETHFDPQLGSVDFQPPQPPVPEARIRPEEAGQKAADTVKNLMTRASEVLTPERVGGLAGRLVEGVTQVAYALEDDVNAIAGHLHQRAQLEQELSEVVPLSRQHERMSKRAQDCADILEANARMQAKFEWRGVRANVRGAAARVQGFAARIFGGIASRTPGDVAHDASIIARTVAATASETDPTSREGKAVNVVQKSLEVTATVAQVVAEMKGAWQEAQSRANAAAEANRQKAHAHRTYAERVYEAAGGRVMEDQAFEHSYQADYYAGLQHRLSVERTRQEMEAGSVVSNRIRAVARGVRSFISRLSSKPAERPVQQPIPESNRDAGFVKRTFPADPQLVPAAGE